MATELEQGADRPGLLDAGPAAEIASRLRGLVLLAGTVRASALTRGIGRSLLDLPVEPGRSVLALWRSHAERLAEASELEELEVKVLVDRHAAEPRLGPSGGRAVVRVERDRVEFRGTGGILRDLCADYDPGDYLLVASAAQVLIEPLAELAAALFAARAQVSLFSHVEGNSGGLMLVNCGAMASLPGVGFLDLKEQVLPKLASRSAVRVVRRRHGAVQVRTLDGYLAGVRAYHRLKHGLRADQDPFAEDWSRTFAIVEDGAEVDATANIHDSVVLAGARAERGAVVVRSVICPGAAVRAGRTVADEIVAPGERAGRGGGR